MIFIVLSAFFFGNMCAHFWFKNFELFESKLRALSHVSDTGCNSQDATHMVSLKILILESSLLFKLPKFENFILLRKKLSAFRSQLYSEMLSDSNWVNMLADWQSSQHFIDLPQDMADFTHFALPSCHRGSFDKRWISAAILSFFHSLLL